MVLYKITFQIKVNPDETEKITYTPKTVTKWVGSQADGSKERGKIRSRHDYIPSSVQTDKIDVPTNKKGLLAYLNSI